MYQKARLYVTSVILFCVVLLSCCSNKDADFDPRSALASNPTTTASTQTLTWDAPATYTDGSNLVETDIKEYRIYYSTSPITQTTASVYSIFSDPDSGLTPTSLTVNDVISQATGTYYFRITAVDTTNMESDLSNEVSRNFQ